MSMEKEIPLPEGVDSKKAKNLIRWLIDLEDENDKTHQFPDSSMIQKIGKKIQDDVRCL